MSEPLKLWLLSQTENDGYDTYDSAIVAAADEADARTIHPGGDDAWNRDYHYTGWARYPTGVNVQLIGTAEPDVVRGVILASFNVG